MNGNHLSIGAMAKINHTTVPTLRLYDKLGILKPNYTDPQSRYRYYDIKQNARFDMIQYMKELGMELKEVKEILDREDISMIESVLIKKREQNMERIEHLRLQRNAIDRTIEGIERYRKSPNNGTLTFEYIGKRRIYSMHTDVNFYDYEIDTYEVILKQFKEHLIRHYLPRIYYCNAGTFLSKENFLNLKFISDKIFIFVDEQFPLKDATETLDNGMYACIYLDDFDKEREYASRLLEYCIKNGYTISGDYICEVLMEYDIFDKGRRSMFLRLQVPVSFKK